MVDAVRGAARVREDEWVRDNAAHLAALDPRFGQLVFP